MICYMSHLRPRHPFGIACAVVGWILAPHWPASLYSPLCAAGIVSRIKVLSDKVPDVSSLDAWRASFIRDGMSDQEKALAVWRSAWMFRHQDVPPDEYLQREGNVHDPIKLFNVYGYGMCCCASASVQALARHAGLESRGWAITSHSVPEVFWDGAWHMLDASLICYFPHPDGRIASVSEISEGVWRWLESNPQLAGNERKLAEFMRNGGWKKGPAVLANCPQYDHNGWLPAATHGWYSTIMEYSRPSKNFIYEYGAALGYEVNIQLRPGQRLVRNWSNRGLHVNMKDGKAPGCIRGVIGKGDLRYSPKEGDLAPGRVGNGTFEYNVPLARIAEDALEFDNLIADGESLRVADDARPGMMVLRMPSSYVYLTGKVTLKAVVPTGASGLVELSDNNGMDWREVCRCSDGVQEIDISDYVLRRYDYRLRLTLRGAGCRLDSLSIFHDIQHSQRVLPALDAGVNVISFQAGPDEGTIVIEGSTNPAHKGRNLLYSDFRPKLAGMRNDMLFIGPGGRGEAVFCVNTPGAMKRIRIGAHYRARDKRDRLEAHVSCDNGRTWMLAGTLDGPTPGNSKYFVFNDVTPDCRAALVRFAGVQYNTTGIFDLRISADYAEPRGGFSPVRVTYLWDENGVEKRHVHLAEEAKQTWRIECAAKPTMKSICLEMP